MVSRRWPDCDAWGARNRCGTGTCQIVSPECKAMIPGPMRLRTAIQRSDPNTRIGGGTFCFSAPTSQSNARNDSRSHLLRRCDREEVAQRQFAASERDHGFDVDGWKDEHESSMCNSVRIASVFLHLWVDEAHDSFPHWHGDRGCRRRATRNRVRRATNTMGPTAARPTWGTSASLSGPAGRSGPASHRPSLFSGRPSSKSF